uniref:Uncharacterized protein n=1 Tax=Schizaphis graminum TaxID=13262 RepID=A0A2S2NF43_SCHGA
MTVLTRITYTITTTTTKCIAMKVEFIGQRRRIVRRPPEWQHCAPVAAAESSGSLPSLTALAPVTPSRFSWCAHAIHNRLPCSSRAVGDDCNTTIVRQMHSAIVVVSSSG